MSYFENALPGFSPEALREPSAQLAAKAPLVRQALTPFFNHPRRSR
jgi:hypothetical protein